MSRYFNNLLFITFLFYLLFSSCSEDNTAGTYTIDVSFNAPSENTPFGLTQFIQGQHYIEIKGAEQMGSLRDIIYSNGYFYIKDDSQQKVIVVDENGQIVRQVGNRGRAKGEYISFSSYDINPSNGEILIYDIQGSKFVVFSKDGKFSREINVVPNMVIRDFAVFSNGDIICYTPDYIHEEFFRGVWLIDSNGNFKKQLVTISPSIKYCVFRATSHYFNRMSPDDVTLLGLEGDDNIYHFSSNGEVSVPYALDFGIKIPDRILGSEIPKDAEKSVYYKRVFYENERYFYLISEYKGKKTALWFDKAENLKYYTTSPESEMADVDNRLLFIGSSYLKSSLAVIEVTDSGLFESVSGYRCSGENGVVIQVTDFK